MDDLTSILQDLDEHTGLFDMDRNGLGDRLLDVAVNGVKDHFNAEVDPDGNPWPELQSDYKRWKDRHFPGEPIGVQTGMMRAEIDGETQVDANSAEWTYGRSEVAKQEAGWFSEGDPEQNRKPRPFADLNAESISRSDQILDTHFEQATQ